MSSRRSSCRILPGRWISINDTVNYDPRRIEEINERLSVGYKLLKKHGLRTTAELLTLQRKLELGLQDSLQAGRVLPPGTGGWSVVAGGEKEGGRVIGGQAQTGGGVEEQVNRLLKQVGMPNARLKVQVQAAEPGLFGMRTLSNSCSMRIRATGSSPSGKVASGGELSRLMLCIKSLVAESIDLATLDLR
jgi:DNA repair protein RecN (Recombination protein N)